MCTGRKWVGQVAGENGAVSFGCVRHLRWGHLRCGSLLVQVRGGGCQLVGHEDVGWQISATVGDGGDHADELDRGDGDFLADGEGTDGRGLPAADGTKQTAGFTGKLDAGARAEAELLDILIELVGADLECEFNGGDIRRFREGSGHGNYAEPAIALVVVNGAAKDGDLAALAIDRVVGRGDF